MGLEEVLVLRAVTYAMKQDGRKGFGFIAEEVEKIDPLLVYYDKEGRVDGVQYPYMTALLAKAIQELDARVEGGRLELAQKIDAHEERLERLEAQVEALQEQLKALQRK